MINIKGLNKIEVLEALYIDAKPLGMGKLHYVPGPLPENAKKRFMEQYKSSGKFPYFDYLLGRVMKVDLNGDEFDERLYERDNGSGSAMRAIAHLLKLEEF